MIRFYLAVRKSSQDFPFATGARNKYLLPGTVEIMKGDKVMTEISFPLEEIPAWEYLPDA